MPPPPRPFRLVYRAFSRIEFDDAKIDELLRLRGFDLLYVRRIFPGYVLEREDTRGYPESRYQVIGELLASCTSWSILGAEALAASSRPGSPSRTSRSFGMTSRAEPGIVIVDQSDPNRGRFDPSRVGRPHPDDDEPRPRITPEDIEATRAELEELKRRTRRKVA